MDEPTVELKITPPEPESGAPAVVLVNASAEQLAAAQLAGEQTAELSTLRTRMMELETQLSQATELVRTETLMRESAEASLALALAVPVEPEETEETVVISVPVPKSSAGEDAPAKTEVPRRQRGPIGRLFLGRHPGL